LEFCLGDKIKNYKTYIFSYSNLKTSVQNIRNIKDFNM
jgi:hypothetical protein